MTKPDKAQVPQLMHRFEQVCRSNGLRITHQRHEIFRELARFQGHPTAERLFNRVRKRLKMISLDTIYRTIATFEKAGLVKRVQLLDNSARLEINMSDHHHLVCLGCKKIEDFTWPDFDRMNLPGSIRDWRDLDSKHVEIRGLCLKCKSASRK